jgi:hypothetical protein
MFEMTKSLAGERGAQRRKSSSPCRSPRERMNRNPLSLATENPPAPAEAELDDSPIAVLRINGSIVIVAVSRPG